MAKRNPEPEGTREAIRQTASELFITSGVHAASLSDIAQAANMSKGTLYYHYPTKEALVLDVAEDFFAETTERLFSWIDRIDANTPVEEALSALLTAYLPTAQSIRLHAALCGEALRGNDALQTRLQMKLHEWSLMLEMGGLKMSGREAQRFSACSRSYLALLDGCATHSLLNGHADQSLLYRLLTDN